MGAIMYKDMEYGGGGGGTEVVPNPLGTPLANLNTIQIDNDIYRIPGGTAGVDLEDLEDVNITSPSNGQVLKYDSANDEWVNAAEAGGASVLEDLTDVDITSLADGEVLVYNGTSEKWENKEVPSGTDDYSDLDNKPSINSVTLSGNKTSSDLGIVITLTQAQYDVLSTQEKNDPNKVYYISDASGGGGGSVSMADITDVEFSNLSDGQILKYDAANSQWVNDDEAGGSSALVDLEDVNISSPTDGQILKYDATSEEWINDDDAGGTEVEANPQEEPTDSLETIKIGDTVYNIPEGGGDSYKRDTLFESTTDVSTFALSHPYTDYDAIVVTIKYSGSTAGTYYATGYFTTDQLTNNSGSYGIATDDWYVYFEVANSTSFTKSSSRYSFVCKIEGLKFGSGGGGSSSYSETVLYEGTATAASYTLSEDISDFDAVFISAIYDNNGRNMKASVIYPTSVLLDAIADDDTDFTIVNDVYYTNFKFTDESTIVRVAESFFFINEVIGINYGSGSGGGTDVEANPQDTPTDTLETIKIGDVVYDIAGSAGGGGKFKDEMLYENTSSSNPSTITLDEDYTEFDMIVIKYTRSSQEGDYTWHSTYLVDALPVNSAIELTGWQPASNYLHYRITNETTLTFYNQGSGVLIREIHGLKLNGSGGSIGSVSEIVTQSNTAIADGTSVTLNLTKKYNDPYVMATNILPKTAWGGLVIVDEDYGVTYDRGNNTISFKVYTNRSQNYDINWLVFDLSNDTFAQNNYSTTEQVAGTWVDGKTIYKTTIDPISSASSGQQQVSLSTYGISNVDTICKIEGVALTSGGSVVLNYFNGSGDCFNLFMTSNNTVIVLAHYGSWSNSIQTYITLYYTKTSS